MVKTKFECECHGCRNYPSYPGQVWHESQIPSKEKGTYFFSREAMRCFSSRISDFKSGADDSLSVIVSSRHGYEGAERYYEIVTLCKFGMVHRESAQFETLGKARKAWDATLAGFMRCACHGCVLDREGR